MALAKGVVKNGFSYQSSITRPYITEGETEEAERDDLLEKVVCVLDYSPSPTMPPAKVMGMGCLPFTLNPVESLSVSFRL